MIFLSVYPAWAEEWIHYATTPTREVYYDHSSIKKLDGNLVRVRAKAVLNEKGKQETFAYLKKINNPPGSADILSHVLGIHEFDCTQGKVKDDSLVIYDERSRVVYPFAKDEAGRWKDIPPHSVGEILKDIVCEETGITPEEAVHDLVMKWLNSWQTGDMEMYRRCYAPDFQSKGMNLDAWVAYKAKVHRKSKKINIRIDKLQISIEEDQATAVFTQYYRSTKLKDSGKKKLELRKIDDEWKIYREIM